tara:strand:- start:11296 stop:11934 length:639 start_codon:yes stop_codon:yes gene_type:complete
LSNPDSFIDEVTEEVRRDRLYGFFRKWGWVGVLLVVVIVGGAAVNEYLKARDARQAQETGDALLTAMDTEGAEARLSALDAVPAEGDAAAVIDLIRAAEAEDAVTADGILASIESDAALPTLYRDLATMKRVLLPDSPMSAADKAAALEPLTTPGGPFRVLAEEQLALADVAAGDSEAALARLQSLMDDAEAGDAVRDRASQLIVALGGTVE